MNKIPIILILIMSMSTNSYAFDSWSKADIYRELGYSAVVVLDIAQTKQGINSGNFKENNPFLGKYPSDEKINEQLLTVLLGHILISHYLSSDSRKMFQNVSLIIGITNISENHAIGARINF